MGKLSGSLILISLLVSCANIPGNWVPLEPKGTPCLRGDTVCEICPARFPCPFPINIGDNIIPAVKGKVKGKIVSGNIIILRYLWQKLHMVELQK